MSDITKTMCEQKSNSVQSQGVMKNKDIQFCNYPGEDCMGRQRENICLSKELVP